MTLHILGVDIAKSTFQLHGADSVGKVVLKKRLPRHKLGAYIANSTDCRSLNLYWTKIYSKPTSHSSDLGSSVAKSEAKSSLNALVS